MNLGYALLLLLGLCWTLVAILSSAAKSRKCRVFVFYFTGSTVAVTLLFLLGGTTVIRELLLPEKRFAIACFALCSILNGTGQAITMWNLKKGGRALAYAIPQLAFLCPFLWSIFFWGQILNWRACGGILLIVGAALFLSLAKHEDKSSDLSAKRVLISAGAMLICGISQILMTTPTQLPAAQALSSFAGACVIQGVNALFFLLLSAVSRIRGKEDILRSAKFGVLWGVVATIAYLILLSALRLLKEVGQSGIVFAVGCGITIAAFTLFTVIRYREKQTVLQWTAFAAIIAGIVLVKV